MATYLNDLRLKEIATGDESGTWGTSTNTNLSIISEAFSFGTEAITTNADTFTSTIADGSSDEARSLYLKYTGTLDSSCTITIGPNTISKLWFIENATSGSQDIIISQGSGANVTIANGQVKAIYSDGAGSGAAMVDAFQDLSVPDLFIDDDLSLQSDAAVINFGADADVNLTHVADTGLLLNSSRQLQFGDSGTYIHQSADGVLDLVSDTELELNATTIDINGAVDISGNCLVSGEVQTANIGFTDGDNAMTIADGGAVTFPQTAIFSSGLSAGDSNITNVGDIALDSISADGSSISIASPVVINGTTPSLTIGDAGAEDTSLVFDGNAKDFYLGLDDSADKLVLGVGSSVGTNGILTLDDDSVTIGDGAAADTKLVYDGNAKDFYIGLDDSADKLVLGVGSSVGTNNILTLDDDSVVIGDGAAVDTSIVFDGNAQDFYIALDDSADDLLIGNGSTVGSNVAIGVNASQVVQFNGAYTFPTSDGSANQVLTTNGSGALSFADGGGGTPTLISDADGDTKVQTEESSDEDIIRFDTAGSEKMTLGSTGILEIVPNTGVTGIRLKDDGNTNIEMGSEKAMKSGGSAANFAMRNDGGNVHIMTNGQNNRLIVFQNGDVSLGGGTSNIINSASGVGVYFENGADLVVARSGGAALSVLRQTNDGQLIRFKQAGSEEGDISVSGSTVSYNGFSGRHESSGIADDVPLGSVVSSIDELDVYVSGSKSGQVREDHPKIKVSDSVGDTRVYGVLTGHTEADGKPLIASVGIGSVLVTGACSGGDLLESNGDGTAKVQSDDVIKSKTIGKVSIGNSSAGVKSVSCVLYCG
jgi:hypothetical protein